MKRVHLLLRGLVRGTIVAALTACSYQPEDPGQCKLICGKSIIGAADSNVGITAKTTSVDTVCAYTSAGAAVGPYRAIFLVGEDFTDELGTKNIRPVPNVSIEPVIVGNRPKVGNENDADSRYQGILTLQSNWCSDACGLVTIDVASQCPGVGGSGDLSVQVHSGALFSEQLKFPISTEEPPEDTATK